MGSLSGHLGLFGMTLVPFWDDFGMTLGSLWIHFGMTLASLWGALGSLWDGSGITDNFGVTASKSVRILASVSLPSELLKIL